METHISFELASVISEVRRVTSRLSSMTVVSRRGDEGKEVGRCRGETRRGEKRSSCDYYSSQPDFSHD